MIRLRREIDRALANPWLRFLVIFLLGGLLALVFVHFLDHGLRPDGGGLVVCLALALAIFVVPRALRTIARARLRDHTLRGPPRVCATSDVLLVAERVTPLRR